MRVEHFESGVANPDNTSSAYQTCLAIRREVFIVGQDVPLELEFDGLDTEAEHFLAFADDQNDAVALGTARMRIVDGFALRQACWLRSPC